MTETATPVERPSPAAALERTFAAVRRERMRDVPLLNPALDVESVGFRPWRDHWLGVVVTPWFMNLVLMPRVSAAWQPLAERDSRHYVFPGGVFEFFGAREAALGDYQVCSLFSPMFEFSDQREARATALAALEALFDPSSRESAQVAAAPAAGTASAASVDAVPVPSKRDFLLGTTRGDRGP